MKALKHIGKQPLHFTFDAYFCDVRGVPLDSSQVAISWERGNGKMSVTSDGRHTEPTGSEDKMATIDTTLSMPATLYRSARRCVYDAKPTIIRVLDLSGGPYATPTVLGTVDFDLSLEVDLNEDSPARSKQVQVPRALPRKGEARRDSGSGHNFMTIQMTIKSIWHHDTFDGKAPSPAPASSLYPSAGSGPPGPPSISAISSSGASNSAASNASTHDAALLSLMDRGSHGSAHGGGGGAGPGRRALSFERGKTAHARTGSKAAAAAQDTGRIAELSQLVASATADARAAETQLSACQYRLKTEVVKEIETVLEKAKDGNNTNSKLRPEELVKVYHKQLVNTLDQVGRIAESGLQRAGGVSPLEAEVLSLRRELADSKVEVARLMGENEELQHVSKRLTKQLAAEANERMNEQAAMGRPRRASMSER